MSIDSTDRAEYKRQRQVRSLAIALSAMSLLFIAGVAGAQSSASAASSGVGEPSEGGPPGCGTGPEGPATVIAQANEEAASTRVEPTTCTYRTYQWSTVERRGVNRRTVEKAYADVTDVERSPDEPRCTVCQEDQVMLDPAEFGIDDDPIGVCWLYADSVRAALTEIAADPAFDLVEVTAYRPGQTRGRVVDGLRTEWSNHSFGTAIDINADHNGLYRSCNVDEVNSTTIRECSLGIGGHWDPDARPTLSVTPDSSVYRAFVQSVGWLWGGEIEGSTRDLMHFSLTGY